MTALQIALVLLLESWGIRASINCGHSSGEIGAAFACGALDLRSCMAIAYFRGQATTEMNGMGRKGAMIAVGADAALVGPLVSSTKTGFATIACYNSPRSLTVSGDEAAVQELKCMLDARGIFNRLLAVDVAYHSNHMLEVADWYLHRLRSMNLGGREGVEQKTFISSLMAFDLDAALLRCPEYWVLNLTSPVQFSASMSIALDKVSEAAASMPVIVEIGPHHALRGPIREIVQSRAAEDPTQKPAYVPSLKRGGCSNDDVLELVASLLNAGQPVEAASVARATLSPDRRVLTDLPPYAFTRDKQYWQTSRAHQLSYYGSTPWNVLLGHRIASDAGSTLQFRHLFSLEDVPWLKDHQISGQIIFPMAGYICAVLEALTMTTPPTVVSSATGFLLREIVISKAFVLQEQEPNDMLIRLTPQRMDTRSGGSADTYAFEISSWTQQSGFVEHCRGLANQTKPDSANVVSPSFSLQRGVEQTRARVKQLRQACTNSVPCDAFYERAAQSGLQYGPSFQLLTSLWTGFNEAWGTIEPFDTASVMPQQFEPQLILHPTLLDAMLHTGFCNAGGVRGDPKGIRCHVPTFVQELRIQASHDKPLASKLDVYVSVSEHSAAQRSTTQDFVAVDQGSGSAVIEMRGLKMFKMDDGLLQNAAHVDVVNPLTVEWHLHPDFLSSATLTEMRDKRQDVEEEEEARWRREQACYYWIERALLSAPSKPKPIYLQRLRRWMRRTVARITSAPPSSRESAWPSMSREDRDRFLDGFEADGADGDFYANAGTNLGAILREEVTSLDVLMQDNRLNRIYDETTCVVPAFHLAGDVIDQISHQNPFMRICEVGSGMGGSTIRVLEKIMQPLPRCSSYHYTDVSTGFFDAARNKFAAYSDILNFKRLDIVEDIEQQGFEPHSYDVVLAGDVVHATPDVQESLCNVRKLLKPDGVFVLVELFGDAAATLPFATLPGWWHHEEGPTLSLDDWNLRLEQAGFTGIDCEIKDNPGFPLHSVILARLQSVRAPAPSPRNVELLSTGGDIDSHLAQELAKALIPSNIVNDKGNLPNGHSHNAKADHQQQTSSEAVKTDHATTSHMQTKPRNVSVCIDELFKPLLAMPTPAQLAHIQGWFTNTREVLWVTRRRSAEMDGVLSDFAFGFARCVRQELAGLKLVVLQLEDTDQSDLAEAAAAIAMVFNHCFVKRRGIKESELDFRFTQGSLRFPRVMPLSHIVQDMRRDDGIAECKLQPLFQDDRIHTLRIDEVGSLSRLYFASTVLPYDLDDDELLIQISATGLNFKDLLKALGQVPGQSLGIECCGVVVRAGHNASRGFKPGDRVMHIGAGDMFASQARIASQSVVKVPECINDHEAAAIGVIYVTAYESLVTVAKLQPGETVLIHAAAGGVGQAAIMIAQWIGAEVYCTVGTPGKKDLLISEFGIAEDRIFWSRSADFSRCIQLVTRGRGVDVLLNCLSGDLLRASWNCMAQFGRFVEIGRRDFQDNTLLEMAPFGKALTYAAVDVAALVDFKPSYVRQVLQIVVDLVASGAVRPPKPLNVVPVSGAPQAFRNLQGGKTPGKTVVVNEASSMVNVRLNAASATAIRSDRSYLITGGTGGLGRSLTRWLIARGASEIILASRSGGDRSATSDLSKLASEARAKSIKLHIASCDVSDSNSLSRLLQDATSAGMSEVAGVIHGAMALHDALFEAVSHHDWMVGIHAKILGAFNLHREFQARPLDFLLCLSSMMAITGNSGQSSYGGSNAVLDAFAQWRRHQGLPTATVDLPGIRGAGYIAEMSIEKPAAKLEELLETGLDHDQFLRIVERALTPQSLTSVASQYSSVIAGFPVMASRADMYREFGPLFATLLRASQTSQGQETKDRAPDAGLRQTLKTVETPEAAFEAICEALADKFSSILMIPRDEITRTRPMADMGLDSLISVELRNWIVRETEATIPVIDVVNSESLLVLGQKIMERRQIFP